MGATAFFIHFQGFVEGLLGWRIGVVWGAQSLLPTEDIGKSEPSVGFGKSRIFPDRLALGGYDVSKFFQLPFSVLYLDDSVPFCPR
jgi:hypothetical protein